MRTSKVSSAARSESVSFFSKDDLQEAEQECDGGGSVRTLCGRGIAYSQKPVCHNASKAIKHFAEHILHGFSFSNSSLHPKRATSSALLRSGSLRSLSWAFVKICCVCSEFQSSRKAESWLVVVMADFLTLANICALLVCGCVRGETSVGTVERRVSS